MPLGINCITGVTLLLIIIRVYMGRNYILIFILWQNIYGDSGERGSELSSLSQSCICYGMIEDNQFMRFDWMFLPGPWLEKIHGLWEQCNFCGSNRSNAHGIQPVLELEAPLQQFCNEVLKYFPSSFLFSFPPLSLLTILKKRVNKLACTVKKRVHACAARLSMYLSLFPLSTSRPTVPLSFHLCTL